MCRFKSLYMHEFGGFGNQRFTFNETRAVITPKPRNLASALPLKFVSSSFFLLLSHLFLNVLLWFLVLCCMKEKVWDFTGMLLPRMARVLNWIEVLRIMKKHFLRDLQTPKERLFMEALCVFSANGVQ